MKIGDQITLDHHEQRFCKAVAKLRYESNRKSGVTNAKVGGQSNELTDLEGVGSEVAFCKMANVYPANTFAIEPRSAQKGEDNSGDAFYCDKVVDVKSTTYSTGRLLAVPWKGWAAGVRGVDCYVLMTGNFPSYIFRGFMTAKELLQKKRIGDLGHGATYIAHQDELKEFEDLSW